MQLQVAMQKPLVRTISDNSGQLDSENNENRNINKAMGNGN